MAKLSFMKFYPADWMNDTMVLSAEARGCWISMIVFMWNAPERGRWTGTYEEFARITGSPWEAAPRLIIELEKVATVTRRDNLVTLESRRQLREQKEHENNMIRQRRFREQRIRNANVTPKTLDVRRQTPQDVRQNQETPTPAEPPKSEASAPATPAVMDAQRLISDLARSKRMGASGPLSAKISTIPPKTVPEGPPPPYKAPETPLAKFLVGIKILQGYRMDDRAWDSVYFARYAKAAKDMLKFFNEDWEEALRAAEGMVKEFKAKGLSWTVETLVRNAPARRMQNERA